MANVVAFREPDLPPPLKAGAIEVLEGAWPSGRSLEQRMSRPLANRDYAPVCMLLVEGDLEADAQHAQVLAFLVIPTKRIVHAGREYIASGLSAVSTHPAHRARGYGSRLVRAAYETLTSSDADLAIFTCDEPLAPFYESCGFTLMPTTTVVGGTREQPFRSDSIVSEEGHRKVALMAAISDTARARWSDFEDSDVYLELRAGDLW